MRYNYIFSVDCAKQNAQYVKSIIKYRIRSGNFILLFYDF
eukprot:UN21169